MTHVRTKASEKACQLSWCLALPSRHARWQDLAVADYSRPPSEAYLPKRDAVLKPCQTISPGFTKGKAPLDILCYRRCYTSKGRPQCRNRHHQTPCLGNTGKTNVLKIHHHENIPKCEALGSPNTNKQVKNSTWERSPCKDGWNDKTLTLQGDLQEWGFDCGMEAPNVTSGWTDGSIPRELNFAWEALPRVPRLLLSAAPYGENI